MRNEVNRMWQGRPLLSDEELQRIDTPTLLIIGEEDVVALEHAEAMARLLPQAQLEVITAVVHNVPQAASAQVLVGMLAFFSAADCARFLHGPAAG